MEDHRNDGSSTEMNYGAGKSRFYAASDSGSHASVSKLQPKNTNKDRTLYLSRYAKIFIRYTLHGEKSVNNVRTLLTNFYMKTENNSMRITGKSKTVYKRKEEKRRGEEKKSREYKRRRED